MSCAIGNSEVSSDSLMLESIGVRHLYGPRISVRRGHAAISPEARGPFRLRVEMPSTPRKGMGKKLRFSIFARDGFACRYCGAQADSVKLVVDHVLPVAEGGTNDEPNLITACEPCNQGKGARLIEQSAPTDADRLRIVQEAREQQEAAEMARKAVEAREEYQQTIVNLWCGIRRSEAADPHTIRVMASYAKQHGVERVAEWIEWAESKLPYSADYKLGQYISGIRRRLLSEGSL